MPSNRTIEVSSEPRLAPVFLKAVAMSRLRSGTALPRLDVVRRDIRVDADRLAAYAHLTGFPLRNELPSTYLHNLSFPLQVTLFADRSYPYPLTGNVHLSNRITQHRPVLLDEPVTLTVRTANARPHRRGALADVIGEGRVGDDLVWEGVSTYLYRGQQADGTTEPQADEGDAVDGSGALWRLPGDLGRRFADVSGDVNPIHLNSLAAKALGFPTTIAHGAWSMARMLGALENRLPDAYSYDVSFRKPVLIPSTVRFVARRDAGTGQVALALRNHQKGTEHARGTITPLD
ncbi:MaoC family dehydratase [Luteipulveratus flavus]|uniref:MaoC/PaaZ C-terminal domain-containing protein n=1 Tax=Luteipulveratus flavus TaxID=3031728 RepID=A0ABT6C6M6_9MICO|nr:MaoC/PaaZ C-terminal domain-containing protein [Luteipulveratus sp. YIM 133296]MDF8264495.1 MaoC/PaaZ C-terminal domain-containing protein [Luteipulveratus sp. YIM 133296]